MIKGIIGLCFIYFVAMTIIPLLYPMGKPILRFVFWSAIALIIAGVVGPRANQVLDDIHNASVTYTKVKEGVDTVTKWPDAKEMIPIIGTGPNKLKP